MKIIHVLADGSIKDDITGYMLNPEMSREFYELLKRINHKSSRN